MDLRLAERALIVLLYLLERVFRIPVRINRTITFDFTTTVDGVVLRGAYFMEIPEGKSVTITAVPKTSAGHPAKYQVGSAVFKNSDESGASKLTVDPTNELSCRLDSVDGSTNVSGVVSVNVDADPSDAVDVHIGTLDFTLTQGNARVFDMTASAPFDTPADVPPPTPVNP